MAALIPNIAKGRVAHLATLPLANDGLVAVLLTAAQAEATLRDHATLAALLAASGNTEATFAGYSRKALTGVTVTVDNATDIVTVDCADPSWSPTAVQNILRIVFCYDPDTTGGTDADLIPIFIDDFAVTTPTSGTITYTVAETPAPAGFLRAT